MGKDFSIDISVPQRAFQDFLTLDGNNRIIFSAPFGAGKTYFLKKFFSNSSEYVPLHLYPTNYSVSKSEDIFELIKFDIFYEILSQNISYEKVDVSFADSIPFLDSNEQAKVISQFLPFIPKIGKTVGDVFDSWKNLNKVIEDKKKKIGQNELASIKEFAQNIHETKGSIYEVDFYTQLILSLINRMRTELKKQVVLIVDDLDRIDPDHVFRLLNVFASHLDLEQNEENKFGFDKIIFCCDVENIRMIFHNKFGQNVDFSG